jgi:nucleoid DNA-binding protein
LYSEREEIKLDITAFIRELLFGHDCVIVPGFGGFIGNYTPARIDKNSGTFYPPVKQISFNRNLNHNDGLLIGKISGFSNMTYGDTRNMVEEFVAELRRKLEKGEKIVFENIGSFVNNQEGNIQFEPDRNANYYLDSYGLESFQFLPLEGYDIRKRIIRHVEKDPVRQTARRKLLWRAAVILPLLSILVVVPLKTDLFKAKIEATTMNPLVSAEFENNKAAVDGEAMDDHKTLSDSVIPEKSDSESPVSVLPESSKGDSFYVITGSFKSEANAIQQVNILRSDGFIPEIVSAPNGFYRVCAMMCTDMNTAISRKDSIIKKFPGTWISRKR